MRIGLLSDVHEHVPHLQLALAECDRRQVDKILCLGDLTTRGEALRETVALLAERGIAGVWGNHDFGLCRHPSAKASSRRVAFAGSVLDYFATLQPYLEVEDCFLSHVEPWRDLNDVLGLWYLGGVPDDAEKAARSFAARSHRILISGHHHRWFLTTPKGPVAWDGKRPVQLAPP